jgi:hypothetical protein
VETTSLQTILTSSFNPGIGVWYINYYIRMSVATGSAVNNILTALYIDSTQVSYNYQMIPANASGSTWYMSFQDSFIFNNSTVSGGVNCYVASQIIGSTSTAFTFPSGSDSRVYSLSITRIA